MGSLRFLQVYHRETCIVSPITRTKLISYLTVTVCPESLSAIQGALGTVCEAVDNVLGSQAAMNAFVAIRPPGHHCGEDTPSGFCLVNNVAVAAAHG